MSSILNHRKNNITKLHKLTTQLQPFLPFYQTVYLLLHFLQSELSQSTHHKPPLKLRSNDNVFPLRQSTESEK